MNKLEWQRRDRAAFKARHGYSTASNYRCGGNRQAVLYRDNFRCVACGMTDQRHREVFGRPITIDHKDRNLKHNDLSNLQTLCLPCHGRKDLLAVLRTSKIEPHQAAIMHMRAQGWSCNRIAKAMGVGCKIITKWVRRWNGGNL